LNHKITFLSLPASNNNMAIIRRLNMLPFGSNGLYNPRKRKHCEVSLPTVEPTSVSSSDDDDDSVHSDNSSLALDDDSCRRVVTPPLVARVHFAADFDDDEQDCPPPAADWTYLQDHKAELWYAKTTRQGFQKEALETIQSFKSARPHQVSKFGALYQVKLNDDSVCDEDDDTLTLPLTMRGLEWGITPTLKKKRRHHVRQVLLASGISDLSKRERVAAARARKSSRKACQVAHALAVGQQVVFVDDDDGSSCQDMDDVHTSDSTETTKAAVTGLPPREPLQAKRMRLWQR
jgi:hypothetical protein